MKKYIPLIARLLLGIPLTIFGLMGLFKIMPDPHAFWESQEDFAPAATAFLLNMWDSGFMMLSVVIAHLSCGILLLSNRYVALALAIHLPVSILMVLFHLVLDPTTGGVAYFIAALNFFLVYKYRKYYMDMFSMRTVPD